MSTLNALRLSAITLRTHIAVPRIYALKCIAPFSSATDKIDELVRKSPIVVFMKGTPDAPRCGFSNAVMQILEMHGVDKFIAHDVLMSDEIRQGVKDYSNWPTIPQVYFQGEFMGGCDILIEMHKNGELIEELKKLGIRSALLDKEQGDKDK